MQEAVSQALAPRVRDAIPGDIAFICSTWKQSYWRESPWANRIRWAVFSPHHDLVIRRLLEIGSVLVACDPEREDEIFGYVAFERPTFNHSRGDGVAEPCALCARGPALHFAYVKPAFRRAGVFRALLTATALPADLAGVVVTHGTRTWFSAPPLVDKHTGVEARPARAGLEEKFKATYDPYRWMEPR